MIYYTINRLNCQHRMKNGYHESNASIWACVKKKRTPEEVNQNCSRKVLEINCFVHFYIHQNPI